MFEQHQKPELTLVELIKGIRIFFDNRGSKRESNAVIMSARK